MQVSLDDPFAPAGERWMPVSPRLRTLRRTILLLTCVPVALVATVAVWVVLAWWAAAGVLALAAAGTAWGWLLIERNYRSWGYAERADDLLVARGWMFRRLVVVPYGRMQFVDVTAGPLERRFGLATLQLHTAAAATDATIPGLLPDEAARLRDRLAALGEARSAGL
jgi:membrane protein YdbS with pleckstrin-like domain